MKKWDDEQKFMVLNDSYWIHSGDNQWDVMHGSHTIYLYDDNCFYNNYSWNDGPQLIGKFEDAIIMTSRFVYAITGTDRVPDALLSMREIDRCWDEVQWRLAEAVEKVKKRRYLV